MVCRKLRQGRPAPSRSTGVTPTCRQGRVAIGDPIGHRLGARMVAVLIGERPGLVDSERDCLSNIRPPDGLDYAMAADKLVWLMQAAHRLKLTGVGLKDDVTPQLPPGG